MLGGSVSALTQVSDVDYSTLSQTLDPGDNVSVGTHTDGEFHGRFLRLASESIVIAAEQGERTIAFSDIRWIEKRGDSPWNGALIGGGIWGLATWLGAASSCSPDCTRLLPQAAVVGAAVGAAVGDLIDMPCRRYAMPRWLRIYCV